MALTKFSLWITVTRHHYTLKPFLHRSRPDSTGLGRQPENYPVVAPLRLPDGYGCYRCVRAEPARGCARVRDSTPVPTPRAVVYSNGTGQ
jgi:hypothetical protein